MSQWPNNIPKDYMWVTLKVPKVPTELIKHRQKLKLLSIKTIGFHKTKLTRRYLFTLQMMALAETYINILLIIMNHQPCNGKKTFFLSKITSHSTKIWNCRKYIHLDHLTPYGCHNLDLPLMRIVWRASVAIVVNQRCQLTFFLDTPIVPQYKPWKKRFP